MVDVNKGDAANPNYRSRFVAREINTYKREDLFAATPPLEALKLIFSMTATLNRGQVAMVNDIGRAFFHAKVKRDVYVQLAPEDTLPGEEGLCGKSRYSMYGTRDAPQLWMEEARRLMRELGTNECTTQPCVSYHALKYVQRLAHVDDFLVIGEV